MKKTGIILIIAICYLTGVSQETGTFQDSRDKKVYKTVKIGSQIWMAENLSFISSNSRCYEDHLSNCEKFGRLYTWETAQKVCPIGWHLPGDEEWTMLTDYLGGESVAGGKMKATNAWNSPNTGATNKSRFGALPSGFHSCDEDTFKDNGKDVRFWSSTADSTYGAWGREIYYKGFEVYRLSYSFTCGFSIRCVKD